jgi:hypothetical protein
MISGLLPILCLFMFTLTSTTPLPTLDPATIPVSLRECSLEVINPALIPPFTAWIREQPDATIPLNMGATTYRTTINGTCLQARVYNWSCDHVLNVTSAGVANAVTSIAEQCDGYVAMNTYFLSSERFNPLCELKPPHLEFKLPSKSTIRPPLWRST